MTSIAVCFSTATFRTCAIRDAGGMMTQEEPFADVPLFMRIALKWDFAYLDRPLVGFRLHDETETKRLSPQVGDDPDARERLLIYGQVFFDRRVGFLDDAALQGSKKNRYRALATIRFLVDRAGLGAPWPETRTRFLQIVRLYPRILTHRLAWRLVVAQFGGRRVRHAAHRIAPAAVKLGEEWRSRLR
jgi:hypothetical protein